MGIISRVALGWVLVLSFDLFIPSPGSYASMMHFLRGSCCLSLSLLSLSRSVLGFSAAMEKSGFGNVLLARAYWI